MLAALAARPATITCESQFRMGVILDLPFGDKAKARSVRAESFLKTGTRPRTSRGRAFPKHQGVVRLRGPPPLLSGLCGARVLVEPLDGARPRQLRLSLVVALRRGVVEEAMHRVGMEVAFVL